MNKAYLLIGGNLGNREAHLATARERIGQECGPLHAVSAIYSTAAWGMPGQPDFLNQALQVYTKMNARQLLRKILKIEKSMGRIRTEKYGPRIIDIDILLFNTEIHDIHFLKIPHPELPNRRFALVPLNEIAPDLLHPQLMKTVSRLLDECPDGLAVQRFS